MRRPHIRQLTENLLSIFVVGLFASSLCFTKPTLLQSFDYVLFYRANFQFLCDAVREARLPLWNPYIGLGRPFLADTQNAVFYPPVYLVCLGQKTGLFLTVWSHCLLATFGMRLLGKVLQVGRWQSYLMAFSFLASGAIIARWATGQILYCCAICYIPWLFYFALRSEESWAPSRIGAYALLLALQFLCGHPQVFWFSFIGQTMFICCRSLTVPLRNSFRKVWQSLWHFGVACVWSGGLVAVALFPFLELVNQGNRGSASDAFANFDKLEWEALASLIFPLGVNPTYDVNWEMNLFVGVPILVIGLFGLCHLNERNVRGLAGVLIIGFLIALGKSTPFFGLFYHCLPGFSILRIHSRAGLLVVFVLVCASGVWLSRPHPYLRSMLEMNFFVPVRYLRSGVIGLQVLLLVYGISTIKTGYAYSRIAGQAPDYPFQYTLITQLRQRGLLQPSQPPPLVCVRWYLLPINYAMLDGYSSFDAYTSLFLRRSWDYLHAVLEVEPPQLRNTSVATEIYDRGPFPYRDLPFVAGIDPSNQDLVFATNPAPRAFLAYSSEVVCDYRETAARLAKGQNIHQCALIEQPLVQGLPVESTRPFTPVSIRSYAPNGLVLDTDSPENALLVLAEAWYPGWQAEVDGETFPCVPANLCMRAVPLSAGRHHVRLYFQQNGLVLGGLISAIGILLLLLVVFQYLSRKWRESRILMCGGQKP